MSRFKKFVIFLGDILILYISLAITLLIRYGLLTPDLNFQERWESHFLPFSVIFVVWLFILYLFNLYRYKTVKTEGLFQRISIATTTAVGISIALFYYFPEFFGLTPKVNIVIFGAVFLALKYGWQHLAIFKIFTRGVEKIIVLGNSPLISETVLHLKDNPQIGYKVEAWFDDPENIEHTKIAEKIRDSEAHMIVVQDHLTKKADISKLIYNLLTHEIKMITFWHFYEIVFDKVPLEELEEGWFVENISTHRPVYETSKRIVELILSILVLIIFSPIMLLAGLAVKLTSKGPAIYRQERMGKNDEPFTLYKFRTMYEDSDDGPLWTTDGDTRITPAGRVLRATHIDELPQLINIIKGDISVVGPRAERMELAEKYSELPYYDMRHIVRPGVTGWAQLNYKPSASMREAKEKLCYDLYYIKNRSIFLDLLIILKTARLLFGENK